MTTPSIRSAIQKIALGGLPDMCNAEVLEVYPAKNTCDVKVLKSDIEVYDVVLLSIETAAKGSVLIYPKKGSVVTIEFFGKTDESAQVIKVTEADEVFLMGDEFGGLVKVAALVERLNAHEDRINDIVQKWNAFAAVYAPGSPATVGTPPTLSGQTITELEQTKVEDLENTNVKHG